MNWITTYATELSVGLYWAPMAMCIVGYTARTFRNYRADVVKREAKEFYIPTDTVGTLIDRALVTVLPIANLWAACADVGPQMFDKLFAWIGRVFDQPLVPRKKDSP